MSPSTSWKERVSPDEDARFGRHAEALRALQQARARSGKPARALHAKGNLGVLAEFEVLPGLEPPARGAMFSERKTYPAVVRFSNGSGGRQADHVGDVRGVAVKVIGVDGKKSIPGLEDKLTQDFLAIRTPVVPMRDADEFITLVKAAATPALAPFKLIWGLGFGRTVGLVKQITASMKEPVQPLSRTAYFSALPIKYGEHAAHFAFFPRENGAAADPGGPTVRGADWLGDGLAKELQGGPVSYDVRVQFYVDDARTPIEDASVEWREADAPFVTVARLTLLQQDTRSPRGRKVSQWIEELSFDPWHARADMRPLGNMMRARNHAYRASTAARGALPEPDTLPSFE